MGKGISIQTYKHLLPHSPGYETARSQVDAAERDLPGERQDERSLASGYSHLCRLRKSAEITCDPVALFEGEENATVRQGSAPLADGRRYARGFHA